MGTTKRDKLSVEGVSRVYAGFRGNSPKHVGAKQRKPRDHTGNHGNPFTHKGTSGHPNNVVISGKATRAIP